MSVLLHLATSAVTDAEAPLISNWLCKWRRSVSLVPTVPMPRSATVSSRGRSEGWNEKAGKNHSAGLQHAPDWIACATPSAPAHWQLAPNPEPAWLSVLSPADASASCISDVPLEDAVNVAVPRSEEHTFELQSLRHLV